MASAFCLLLLIVIPIKNNNKENIITFCNVFFLNDIRIIKSIWAIAIADVNQKLIPPKTLMKKWDSDASLLLNIIFGMYKMEEKIIVGIIKR